MIDQIKKLGLNEYESRVYNSMLKIGKSSAVLVSKQAAIPRARVYDVLFSLEKKGFVLRSASKPIEFLAVKPSKVYESIVNSKKEEMESSLTELKSVTKMLEKNSNYNPDFGKETAWVVEGRNNIYSVISEQLENCSESVLISSSEEGIKRKKSFLNKDFDALLKKGVKVISKPRTNSRFVVFDKSSVMLFLNSDKSDEKQEKALLIKSPFIANYFYSNSKK